MTSNDEKWKKYAEILEPYKYAIGGGVFGLLGLFYFIWIVYMIYRAVKVSYEAKQAGVEMKTQLTTEYWKYVLTSVGLCFQFSVIASYIMGKIVKNVLVDTNVLNVSTCDSKYEFSTPAGPAIAYYYISSLFQVYAMLCASCMLSTFNIVLKYLKCVFYKKIYNTQNIRRCIKLILFEFIIINIISIIGIGIPIAVSILFVCILVKFIRFSLNCKEGYKVYKYRIDEIRERKSLDESMIEYGDSLESECIHYGYIATVFCFGAGFYLAQLTFDPLATVVEASCTIFPLERHYIRILFHFMNLLVWGCFAMVVIIYLPFFLPYTLYYTCLACCPAPVLHFLSRASHCFRKQPKKVSSELVQPLISNSNKSNDK